MIIVKYTKNSISLVGHACLAPKGHDIVCAGASAIFFGAALSWFKKGETEMTVACGNGVTLTLLKKTKTNQEKIELIVRQLSQIAKNYKKNIKIIKGE